MRSYNFTGLVSPSNGRGVQIRYSKSAPLHYNVMVAHRDGGWHRVYGPVADLQDAKAARDEIREIIDAACVVEDKPTVHGEDPRVR